VLRGDYEEDRGEQAQHQEDQVSRPGRQVCCRRGWIVCSEMAECRVRDTSNSH
jgi:hypothetical protein